jgi:hypothetical protein
VAGLPGPRKQYSVSHAIFFGNRLYGADRHQISPMSKYSILRFLDKNITELPFTSDFIYRCGMMGFESVRQIVFTNKAELKKMNGFTKKWFVELENRLAEQGMLRILVDPDVFLCLKPESDLSPEPPRYFFNEDEDESVV